MPDPNVPQTTVADESAESFGEIFAQYEKSHARKPEDIAKGRQGTVVKITEDSVLVDIGFKTEGILPLSDFQKSREPVQVGDTLTFSIKGRDPEGYYLLSRGRVERPTDWASLEKAFAEKATIVGTVTGVVKGGLTVDVGVRAFLPASRSGTRDAAELEKLVEQEIRCRITKLDVADEDVVVDRRAVLEEEERAIKDRRYSEVKEGEIVRGTVRSLMDYGAFVDVGGVDALLHVSDISLSRISKPSDVLSAGQEIEVKILKIDPEKRRISVGMKQLEPDPWASVSSKYKLGERVRGTVTRILDFGAFVELEPGVEGLIHISEMSWGKKVRTPSDVVKPGETVEAVILRISLPERRIALGLKQALGDPWAEIHQKFPVGFAVEGPVTSLTKFGAFVQLAEGIEGMVHVSDITAEKRLNHPQEMLKVGQIVKAQVLEIDTEKRRLKLGMKQLVPTSIEEYIGEHKEGDTVSGRVIEVSGGTARVELGEGIFATCKVKEAPKSEKKEEKTASNKADLSSLGAMLQARWKGGAGGASSTPEEIRSGQVRSFRIKKLDAAGKKIEVEIG